MANAPAVRMLENQTRAGGTSYACYFCVRPAHGAELVVVFNHPGMEESTTAIDETFERTTRRVWVQFAKIGNPSLSAEESPGGKAKDRPPYGPEGRQVMVLDEFDIHSEPESALGIVDWARAYFPTGRHWL